MLTPPNIIYFFICCFFFILFAQSAIDKVQNKKENLDWLNSHFKSSILVQYVPFLFHILTILEFVCAFFFCVNIINIFIDTDFVDFDPMLAFYISMLTFLSLFFGQRLARDYEGAKTIAIYFTLNIISIVFVLEYVLGINSSWCV